MSLRDRVLAAVAGLKPRPVDVPELGGTVYVRPMTIGGLSRFLKLNAESQERATVALLIDCLCDESGVSILTPADEPAVGAWPSSIGNALADAIMEVSKVGKGAETDAGK